LEVLPIATGAGKSIITEIIKELKDDQEAVHELYEMLYGFEVLFSMNIPYSEKLEMPGFNIFSIMPGGSLIKLPMPYSEIGYDNIRFNQREMKTLQELWGIPNKHITLREYYPEIWNYYESHYDEISEKKLRGDN
jgi:hypothetical protein